MVRPKTFSYYTSLVKHINPGLGKIPLKKLESQQIQEFLSGKLAKLSVKICRHLRCCLKVALNWAVEHKQIPNNPANSKAIRLPKDEHQVRFMTMDELGAFRAAARGNWMEHAFNVALATGIRESEVLGLRWDRIDLEKRSMLIDAQLQRVDGKLVLTVPKTKKSLRRLTLNQDAVKALTAQKMQQEGERQAADDSWRATGFVFTNQDSGAPIDHRTLLKYFYKARVTARIKDITFHGLRHTYASILLARGVPVKEVSESLGHSDVAFTLRIYVHCMPGFRDKAATEMESAFADADKAQRGREEKEKKDAEKTAPVPGAATLVVSGIPETIN
jgi:integrase